MTFYSNKLFGNTRVTNGVCGLVSALHLLTHNCLICMSIMVLHCPFKKYKLPLAKNATSGSQENPYPVRKPGSGQNVRVSPDRTERLRKNKINKRALCNVRDE